MRAQSAWTPAGPGRYGLDPGGPASGATTELNALATPVEGAGDELKLWHPANPLFWVAVVGAVTFGLMAVSTTVRVGPAKASVALGS